MGGGGSTARWYVALAMPNSACPPTARPPPDAAWRYTHSNAAVSARPSCAQHLMRSCPTGSAIPSTRSLGDARRAPISAGVKDARLRGRSLHQTTEPSERGCCANTNTFASGGPPSVFHPFLVVISTTKNESNFHGAGNDLSQGDPSRHFSSITSSEEPLGDAQMRRLGRIHCFRPVVFGHLEVLRVVFLFD